MIRGNRFVQKWNRAADVANLHRPSRRSVKKTNPMNRAKDQEAEPKKCRPTKTLAHLFFGKNNNILFLHYIYLTKISNIYRTTRAQPPIQYAENPLSRGMIPQTHSVPVDSPKPIRHSIPPIEKLSTPPSTPGRSAPPSPTVQPGTPPLESKPSTSPCDNTKRNSSPEKPIRSDQTAALDTGNSFDMFAEPGTPSRPAKAKQAVPAIVERLYSEYEEFLMSCEEVIIWKHYLEHKFDKHK